MIQWMHHLSRSWVATLLMGGLALSFIVWGIADVFTGTSSTAIATVGSTEISSRAFERGYRNFLRIQSQQSGQEITPDMARSLGLGQVALQQMLSRATIDNVAAKLGLTTPDAAVAQNIQSMSSFRGATGRFDKATFDRLVQGAGYSSDEFFNEVRGDMTRGQLTAAVQGNFLVPAGYAQALFIFLNERRAADYVVVTPDSLAPIPPPDDKTLAAYVKANASRFSTPAYRDIDYAELGPEDLLSQVNVTDAQVKQEFEARKATYIVPEKREVQQLPFANEADAKTARAKFAAGTGFDALIQARGFKPADITSTAAKAELPENIADAAFALPLNGVSEPVKSTFGYVLLRVTKIEPGSNKSFDDVKDDIRKALGLQLAAAKLADIANAFADARSGGATIAQAAKKTGMKAGHVAAIDAEGKAPDGSPAAAPQDPEFLQQVFSAEEGEDNDPFPVKSGNYYVVKVNGVTPPKLKPLDQVRAAAAAAWTEEQRAKLLAQRADALAAQAVKEKSLDGAAAALKTTVQHSTALARNTNDAIFSQDAIRKLFDAAPGGIVSGSTSNGNYVIAKVTGIAHPQILPGSPGFTEAAQQLSQNVSGDFIEALINAARADQGVKVNQKTLAAAIGEGS